MPTEAPPSEIFDFTVDWLPIQEAIGDALRNSLDQVTQDPLPGSVALLLVRLAFAEVVQDIALEEIQATRVELAILAETRAA